MTEWEKIPTPNSVESGPAIPMWRLWSGEGWLILTGTGSTTFIPGGYARWRDLPKEKEVSNGTTDS